MLRSLMEGMSDKLWNNEKIAIQHKILKKVLDYMGIVD